MNTTYPASTRGRHAAARLFMPLILIILSAASARAVPIFGINNANNNLVRFDSATPGTIVSSIAITGLVAGDTIVGLDFRPVDGKLFGLGSGSRLYIIDPATGVATQVGTGTFTTPLSGSAFGFDFNPTVDRIRVVSDADQDLRLDPNTAAIAGIDTNLAYAAADVNFGANPNVAGSAYTNNIAGATTTTLYDIDTTLNILVTQNPPNAGALNTVGPLGVDPSAVLGFDIANGSGTPFASMVVSGVPRLYTINLSTGAATLVGTIGPGATPVTIRAMTVAISSYFAFLSGTVASFTGNGAANTITFDQSGGLLRHNRFSAGDAGFNSDFDFDSSLAGDQTLSAASAAVTIVVNCGDRDDQVVIGSNTAPVSGIAASFQINGQGGGDNLVVNDAASATGRSINVNNSISIVSGFGGQITYGTVEKLDIFAGSGADTINILGIAAAVTSVNTGGGSDNVLFANGASLSGGLLDGGAGTDTVDYTAYTTPVSVDLNETQTLFFALLTGMQEPGPLSNSQGQGRGVFVLSTDQSQLAFNISYTGLTGSPISGTHFHNQVSGVSGPIVRGLFSSEQNGLTTPSGTFAGIWSNSDPTLDPPASDAPIRPLNAPSPVTPGSTLLQELLANRIYFNIHTLPNFPSGELRGQLISQGTVGSATGTGGIRGFENATGGSGADTLTGNSDVNVLHGGAGSDTLVGGAGADQLFGDGGNDTLVGGTSGDQISGNDGNDLLVWNNGDGSDSMDGGAGTDTVQVNGSPTGDDQYLIQVNPADPTRLRFDRTNLGLFNLNIGSTEILDFNPLGGNDTVTVDFAGGNPIPTGGLNFAGDTGSDRLVLQRSANSFTAGSIAHSATGPGAGSVNVDGRLINYTGLEPIDDTVPATNFIFTAPTASPRLQVLDGPNINGVATTQINDGGTGTFELINFARKTNATINTGAVSQLLVLNNTVAPPGLANLTINASAFQDNVSILAVPPGVMTSMNALGDDDVVTVTGAGVPSGTTLFLDYGAGNDQLIYQAGGVAANTIAGPNPGQVTITRAGSGNVIYQNFEGVSFLGVPARALNISTRLRVLPGDNALIGGFIITGATDKKVIVRGIGPSLGQFGLTGLLDDPTLELHDSSGLIGSNDNWRESQESEISATGLAPQNDLESAVVATLAPGNHTVILRGKNNTSGIGVVEAYDLQAQSPSQLANISTRGFVDAGDKVMIGGFILGGSTVNTRVAVRGIGPSLAQVGITNALTDPTLDLYDGNGMRLVFNDNWMDDPAQAAALLANGLAPTNNNESGVFTTLPPGAFTAILAGKGGGIGVGLIEVYNLQ